MRRRNSGRIGGLEEGETPPAILIHVHLGETQEEMTRAYEREHGAIPEDAEVYVIVHTFRSRI